MGLEKITEVRGSNLAVLHGNGHQDRGFLRPGMYNGPGMKNEEGKRREGREGTQILVHITRCPMKSHPSKGPNQM